MRAGRGLIKYGRFAVGGSAGARGKKGESDIAPFDRKSKGATVGEFAMDSVRSSDWRLRLSLWPVVWSISSHGQRMPESGQVGTELTYRMRNMLQLMWLCQFGGDDAHGGHVARRDFSCIVFACRGIRPHRRHRLAVTLAPLPCTHVSELIRLHHRFAGMSSQN